MNILEFLSASKVCDSKSDARRCLKANRISVDFKKLTDEKVDIPITLDEGDLIESIDAGTWMCQTLNTIPETLMLRLTKKLRTLNVKKLDEICDMIMSDIFVVENGKRNFFIVRVKHNEIIPEEGGHYCPHCNHKEMEINNHFTHIEWAHTNKPLI